MHIVAHHRHLQPVKIVSVSPLAATVHCLSCVHVQISPPLHHQGALQLLCPIVPEHWNAARQLDKPSHQQRYFVFR